MEHKKGIFNWVSVIARAFTITLVVSISVPLLFPSVVLAYTEHTNDITANTTWGAGTHYVIGERSVLAGVRLTVSAGAIVKFEPGAILKVYGTLDANGSSGNEVIFTSRDENSYGETISGSDGSPAPGDWVGIWLHGDSGFDGIGEFDYCRIRYGADFPEDGQVWFRESNSGHFANSICEYSGGSGIEATDSSPTIINSVLANNHDGLNVQGALATPIVTNCVIWGNSSTGILAASPATVTVTNCIMWNNIDDLDGCTATYSDIEDGDFGTGNITTDPQFSDPVNGDFHLTETSLCIDAGSNAAPMLPVNDFEGDPRIWPIGGHVDIGADEYIGPDTTPPDIQVSPTDYNFGDVELGSSTTTIMTISNVGGADLTVSNVGFQAGSCGDFSTTSSTLVQPDQVNEFPTDTSYNCGSPPAELGSLFQSFTPSASPLAAVDLLLRPGGNFPPEGYDTTINLRSSGPQGIVLGTATTFVPGALTSKKMVRFSFSEAISLTPGQTYIIEWISPPESAGILAWMGADTNPYPGGTAFGCGGTAVDDTDFVFITYSTTTSPTLPVVLAPNGTLDVEITYTPSAVAPCSGTLEIVSNDPDESLVQVSLIGNGVVVEVPPNEQIRNILDSIDGWVADGSLTGDGPGRSAEHRLNALKNMIETAGDLIDDGDIAGACVQLMDAYRKTDSLTPPESPPDFVTGDSTDDLAGLILDLMVTLGC